MIVVLDASGAMEIIEQTDCGIDIVNTLMNAKKVLSPDLYIAEITNTIWKHRRNEKTDIEPLAEIIEDCIGFVHEFVDSTDLWRDALSLAREHNHSVYDMLYAALAKRNNAMFISMDKELCRIGEAMQLKVMKIRAQ